jgi:hypothetical protein
MGLFDIFSTSFLVTISITVLALCLMFLYFSQKLSEQDHKISSMVDLVTTMAQEIHVLKLHTGPSSEARYPSDLIDHNHPTLVTKQNPLIEVSDTDSDTSSEASDSESEEEEDVSDSESEDESEGEAEAEAEAEEENLEMEAINLDELESIDNNNANDNALGEIKNIDFDEIKAISSLEGDNEDVHHTDYKKMSVDKLRHIVVEKGLVVDASKLKKKDLLKLLGLSE